MNRAQILASAAFTAVLLSRPAVAAPVALGATDAARPITLALTLPSRDPAGAAAFAGHVTRPGDPLYRHYLTPAQYAARFGADPADYAAAAAWAKSAGLTLGEHYVAGTVLPVSGPAELLQRLFAVSFQDFRDPADGHVYYAADREPTLPAPLAARAMGVVGLTSAAHFKPYVQRIPAGVAPAESGSGPNGGYTAQDVRTAYDIPAQSFRPRTQTVAVFEQGGFDPADIAKYLAYNKLAGVPVTPRSVDGSGTGIDDPNVELEAVLDIDMLIATNPALAGVIVYEDGADAFPVALLDSLSAMASDARVSTISISYGQDEALQGHAAIRAENTVLTQMAAQGQAVFASSGDDGAYGNFSHPRNVSDPASQPFITGVGGTTLFTAKKAAYQTEETWNDLGVGAGATGGGVSDVWPLPAYQSYLGSSVAIPNGGSAKHRNVPDVAAVGNPLTGVAVYSQLNGGWVTIGGTSVSSPIWAGFYSLVNAASEGVGLGTVGFANPQLYAANEPITPVIFYGAFHDIVDGSNGELNTGLPPGFSAGQYYDNTTGLGSFDGTYLSINLALLPTGTQTNPPPAPRGLAVDLSGSTATLSWSGSKPATGYLVFVANYETGATVAALLQKKLTASVAGLAPGNTYVFSVSAISPGGFATSPSDIFNVPASR